MVVGFSLLGIWFKGGTLVPNPDILFWGLPIDGNGEFALSTVWPPGIGPGLDVLLQFWIQDPAAPNNFSGTNGLQGITQ